MNMSDPEQFCHALPTQLRGWDATALRAFMSCPRRYQLSMVEGWRPAADDNVHLLWGQTYHASLEQYDRVIAAGESHDVAMMRAVRYALENSYTLGGSYVRCWTCSDPGVPFKSGPRKGEPNLASRCSRAKDWWAVEDDQEDRAKCPQCGHDRIYAMRFAPTHDKKNRRTLVRSVIWWCDEQENGHVKPFVFPDGTVATELSAKLPLPIDTPDGEPYLLCVNLDGIATVAGEIVVRERKTTVSTLGKSYFDGYEPDVQVDTYDLATWLLYPHLHITGVMVEATQTMVDASRFQRHFVSITESRRAEWFNELQYWIKLAEQMAKDGYYPKNTSNCKLCQFKQICRLSPEVRGRFLQTNYKVDRWNPMQER